jgi:hypothetical protein
LIFKNAEIIKHADEEREAAKAEIVHSMMESAALAGANDPEAQVIAEGDGFKLTSSYVAAYPGKEITKEMVGDRIYGRSPYRKLTVSRPKPKKGKKESE